MIKFAVLFMIYNIAFFLSNFGKGAMDLQTLSQALTFNITSISKKLGQSVVEYYFCALSQIF